MKSALLAAVTAPSLLFGSIAFGQSTAEFEVIEGSTAGLTLTVTIDDQVVRTIDLSDLGYMRRMLLEPDGSVWVAGWPGLARIRWDGGEPLREDILDPS